MTIQRASSRLALGTVQFGQLYGIANRDGKVDYARAEAMLDIARKAGLDTLDTAVGYGDAEAVLGRLGVTDFRIISKIPQYHRRYGEASNWVRSQIELSLARLRVRCLDGLLLHAPNDLFGPSGEDIANGILKAKASGLVNRIGLSVYDPEQLELALDMLSVDMVQIPLNVLDRRFIESGWVEKLKKQDIEIHSRSTFLQGLLLLAPNEIPEKFRPFNDTLKSWHDWVSLQKSGCTALQACLSHVTSYPEIFRIIVGADTPAQLTEIITAERLSPSRAPESLSIPSSVLINPSAWGSL